MNSRDDSKPLSAEISLNKKTTVACCNKLLYGKAIV